MICQECSSESGREQHELSLVCSCPFWECNVLRTVWDLFSFLLQKNNVFHRFSIVRRVAQEGLSFCALQGWYKWGIPSLTLPVFGCFSETWGTGSQ